MNAIILTIDRLRASALGAYGNTWFETPELDRLASESFLFDQALIDSPDASSLYRSYLTGAHAWQADRDRLGGFSLADRLRGRGVRTMWISDETDRSVVDAADSFDEKIVMASPEQDYGESSGGAATIEASRQARLWEAGANWLAQLEAAREDASAFENADSEPFLLWVHAQGMAGPWDAPLELRNSLVEEDDPAPPQDATVPNRMLGDDFDPDEIHGAACAYAGQVMALDACLGALLEQFRAGSLGQDTMVVLLGLRGFPLGEHRRLGPNDSPLYEELIHVPCLFRMPGGVGSLGRSQEFFQPPDLYATLLDWFDAERFDMQKPSPVNQGRSRLSQIQGVIRENETPRQFAMLAGGGSQRALRTPAWYFVRDSPGPELGAAGQGNEADVSCGLFAKPDDRWEQNEISARCEEVVESLAATMTELERRIQQGEPTDSIEVDQTLLTGVH